MFIGKAWKSLSSIRRVAIVAIGFLICMVAFAFGIRAVFSHLFAEARFDESMIMPLPSDFRIVARGEASEGTQREVSVISYLAVSSEDRTVDDLVTHFESRGFQAESVQLESYIWNGISADSSSVVRIRSARQFLDSVVGTDVAEMEVFASELRALVDDSDPGDLIVVLSLQTFA